METDFIRAPFTLDQAARLNWWQFHSMNPPFTCPSRHAKTRLVAVPESGWRCPIELCVYTQDWAHSFMLMRGGLTVNEMHRFMSVAPVGESTHFPSVDLDTKSSGE